MARAAAIIVLATLALAVDAAARELQDVLNTGTLRVGVTLFAPWAARGDNNELVGFEADVARQLAADMGVKAQLLAYDIDRLVPALEAGEIDIIAAGLTITPERALHVNFSQPYAESGIGARDARYSHRERLGRRCARQRRVHDRGRRRLGRRHARAASLAAGARADVHVRCSRERGIAGRRSARLRRG